MQFARAAVVVEAIGHVAVLLDLDQADAGADGVDRPRRDVEEIARFDPVPFEQVLDPAIERSGTQFLLAHRFAQADAKPRVAVSRDDQPAFFLARPAQPGGFRLVVVGMELDREFVAGENVLGE